MTFECFCVKFNMTSSILQVKTNQFLRCQSWQTVCFASKSSDTKVIFRSKTSVCRMQMYKMKFQYGKIANYQGKAKLHTGYRCQVQIMQFVSKCVALSFPGICFFVRTQKKQDYTYVCIPKLPSQKFQKNPTICNISR